MPGGTTSIHTMWPCLAKLLVTCTCDTTMTTQEHAVLTLDGGVGEGGGQILRTALALSLATGTPFRLERIRARRRPAGLLRQHLTALNAAVAIGDADVAGAQIGSATIMFTPPAAPTT